MSPTAADDETAIRRYLADLYLGDSLETVQRVYPRAARRDWPAHMEPRGQVKRIRVEARAARRFPAGVELMWLGFKNDRLVEIQLIYDEDYSGEHTAQTLASEFALEYGEARKKEGRFWWDDGETVLRVMTVEHPVLGAGGGRAVALRTGIQLMDAGLFHRKY